MSIVAGPCLMLEESDHRMVLDTCRALVGIADKFRCKIYGGGTSPEKYHPGIGVDGINTLMGCNAILPTGTEIQTGTQYYYCKELSYLWIGARNSQNYGLLSGIAGHDKPIMIKRGSGMTVGEVCGIYDIATRINQLDCYIIVRGINDIDRLEDSRWSPDLKGVIRIKQHRPDIFDRLIVDCSHSVGRKEYIADVYHAFKAIGVKHFMFECTLDGTSKTDQRHMMSVDELKTILEK